MVGFREKVSGDPEYSERGNHAELGRMLTAQNGFPRVRKLGLLPMPELRDKDGCFQGGVSVRPGACRG